MTIPSPEHINREGLMERLRQEVERLTGSDLTWWTSHHVSPFVARYGRSSHFVVAASGQSVIFFADDEDEFGIAGLTASNRAISNYALAGDLRDAVRIIQTSAA